MTEVNPQGGAGVAALPGALPTVSYSSADSDEVLLAGYLSGAQRAFEVLYQRYRGPLYRFFLRQLPGTLAEDAYQETWMKFLRSLDRYEHRGKLQAYLFTLANNVLMDVHRKGMRGKLGEYNSGEAGEVEEAADMGETIDENSNVQKTVSRDQLRQALHAEIAKLPVAQRSVWLLKQETALSMEEIATLSQTTIEGVKSRLRYATAKLKAGMQRYVGS